MNVRRYLRQRATLKRRLDASPGWNNATWDDPVEIRCRKVTKHKWSKIQGQVGFVPVTHYMTEEQINLGDSIDGEEIMAIENAVDFDGSVVFWKSYPRPPLGFTP